MPELFSMISLISTVLSWGRRASECGRVGRWAVRAGKWVREGVVCKWVTVGKGGLISIGLHVLSWDRWVGGWMGQGGMWCFSG